MEVNLPEKVALKLSEDQLRQFQIKKNSFTYQNYVELNLRKYTPDQIKHLRALIEPHVKDVVGGKVLMKDIDTWLLAVSKSGGAKSRDCLKFAAIAVELIAQVPGHRVYMKNDAHGEVWLCYYVNSIRYVPPDRYDKPHTNIALLFDELGVRVETTMRFSLSDCAGMTVIEALARRGIYLETPEMRAKYIAEVTRFKKIFGQVGKQFCAVGFGTDDLDDLIKKPESDSERRSRWRDTNTLVLAREGDSARVVIDVVRESERTGDKGKTPDVNLSFWEDGKTPWREKKNDEDYEDEEDAPESSDSGIPKRPRRAIPKADLIDELPVIEVPTHPFLPCFDLRRHTRLRIHVNYLTLYVYDSNLGSRLVLPKKDTDLLETLISYQGGFTDIVSGKGGGVTILSSGPPGTGKTLSAEVYSEVMERPLYSIQCSQLGVVPETLEDHLQVVFARARRWNAIVLLDEADVYVRKRGDDLNQNAIVGVFLRVLEYYAGVLFLTTNRSGLVDDAIISRCIARIDYETPTPENQTRIWKVLTEVMNAKVSNDTIAKIVEANPELSGRDVKNLLKLAKLVAKDKEITFERIEFVKQFKPRE